MSPSQDEAAFVIFNLIPVTSESIFSSDCLLTFDPTGGPFAVQVQLVRMFSLQSAAQESEPAGSGPAEAQQEDRTNAGRNWG